MNSEVKQDRILTLIIRSGTFLCFAGWSWVHFYWEGPYGALLWDDWTYGLAERLGLGWDEFVGTGANDGLVQRVLGSVAWLYLGATVLTLTVRERSRWQMAGLLAGSGLLVVLSFAKYLGAQRQLPMFVEHGGQMLMPLLLVMALALGARHRLTVATAIVACVTTFAGHGCYALGLWPTPASFFGMTTVILGVDYGAAKAFLHMAGLADFLVCIGLLIPRFRTHAALYAVVWGALTALARPVAGMSWDLNYWGADQYLHEAILRAPHFMIPLFLYALWRERKPVVRLPDATERKVVPPVIVGAKVIRPHS